MGVPRAPGIWSLLPPVPRTGKKENNTLEECTLTNTDPELCNTICCSPSKGVGAAGVVGSSLVRGGSKLNNLGSMVVLGV